jgi:hypothetical protein
LKILESIHLEAFLFWTCEFVLLCKDLTYEQIIQKTDGNLQVGKGGLPPLVLIALGSMVRMQEENIDRVEHNQAAGVNRPSQPANFQR